ncbi:MAG: hypothetical protein D6751_08840 [Deltaproteobacteria bacterium]|nr:MAG: hypothetical protein D6751_08840 [Deltaproteobacteria bacterium]
MAERYEDADGTNIFWPGYVDATTNLALNLLFLLVVMISAVFMFALEMGRASVEQAKTEQEHQQTLQQTVASEQTRAARLQAELDRLRARVRELEAAQTARLKRKNVEATGPAPEAGKGSSDLSVDDFTVAVRFRDDAVELLPGERERLAAELRQVLERGRAIIRVIVPPGFTETRRLGFYRAMVVRNLLIEQHLPADKIDVAVIEGRKQADAALVLVR